MNKKSILISIIGVFVFIIMAGGVSYGYFVYNKDIAIADLETGNISINFNSGSNNFTLSNVQPMNDAMGKIYPEYMDFSVTGIADIEAILYEIEVVPKSGNTIDTKYVKFYLTDQNENVLLSPFTYDELYNSLKNNGKALYQDLVEGNINGTSKTTTNNYRLRVWIDEKNDNLTGGTFSFSVYLYARNVESAGNLLYGLDDTSDWVTASSNYMKYTITNKQVTVQALDDYGYGNTTGRVYLEAGKRYIFNCDVNGTWGTDSGTGTNAAVLYANGEINNIEVMFSNENYEFTAPVSAVYFLRLDVHKQNQTNVFENISIIEKYNSSPQNIKRVTFDMGDGRIMSKLVTEGEDYGELPTPKRDGYIFLGWNGKNKLTISSSKNGLNFNNNSIFFDASSVSDNVASGVRIQRYLNGSYVNDICAFSNLGKNSCNFIQDNSFNQLKIKLNTSKADAEFYTNSDIFNINQEYVVSLNIDVLDQNNAKAIISDVQIEEGETATPYEPYYVTSDVKVTRWNTNMVLKAVWSWNNYKYNDEVQDIEIHGGTMHNDYISLNGTASDYIDLGEIIDKKEVSVQTTIKVSDNASNLSGEKIIVGNYEGGGFGLRLIDGYVGMRLRLDGTDYCDVISLNTIDTSTIHDIVGIYDGKTMKLYIDGILDSTTDLTQIIANNSLNGKIENPSGNTIMAIGGNPTGNAVSGGYFAGDIYSVHIYDYAISEQKIRQNIKKDGFIN